MTIINFAILVCILFGSKLLDVMVMYVMVLYSHVLPWLCWTPPPVHM